MTSKFKSGFISIIGNANVGKSTLLNTFLGEKLTITSHKPQTTRNIIRAIYTDEEAQMVFIDTPGLHNPQHALGHYMSKSVLKTLNSVDLILYLVDAAKDKDLLDDTVLKSLKALKTKTFLIINKIDKINDIDRLKTYIKTLKTRHAFDGVFAVSALKNTHTDQLLNDIKHALNPGPMYYPKTMKTDKPEQFLIAERIREKVLKMTHEEVPHSVAVRIESIENDVDNPTLLNIMASIIVERNSQKGIIIGKGGQMLKKIGTLARKDILSLLGSKIFLDLHVKVIKDWRDKPHLFKSLGYEEEF